MMFLLAHSPGSEVVLPILEGAERAKQTLFIHIKSIQIIRGKLSDFSQSEHSQVTNHHQGQWDIPTTQVPFLSLPHHYLTLLPKCNHHLSSNTLDYFKLYIHITHKG